MPQLSVHATAQLPPDLLAQLRPLLDAAFAGRFSDDDWEHGLGGWHVVVTEGATLVSHAAVVPRVLEVAGRPLRSGYVEAVGTLPAWQGQGLGRAAMERATQIVRDGYELGALSTSSPGFYARLGWERWAGPTYVREGDRIRRTADEDAGLMVLRVGPSAAVDLTASLTCQARAGDDW